MTPKEKAQELVDKFYQTIPNEAWFNYHAWEQAKQCAIIAVDEIIEATIDDWSHYEYWQEVKTELEKL